MPALRIAYNKRLLLHLLRMWVLVGLQLRCSEGGVAMTERIANGLTDPIYDQWDPNWLTVAQAMEYTGASQEALSRRARVGFVIRKGNTHHVRYWKPSLDAMRRAFGGGR